mgnify:CR=1 FL=1
MEIYFFTNRTRKFKQKYKSINLMTIPFEKFVVSPHEYISNIEKVFNLKKSNSTSKRMNREKVPRIKIADGIPLKIYKRCGWVPSNKKFNEREELNQRRDFAINQGVKSKYMGILDKLSDSYEKEYGILQTRF